MRGLCEQSGGKPAAFYQIALTGISRHSLVIAASREKVDNLIGRQFHFLLLSTLIFPDYFAGHDHSPPGKNNYSLMFILSWSAN